MRYPTMGKSQSRTVSVPTLSGGVNLNDPLNLIDDNQLTDCKNVWYKDGILRTRPGIKKINEFDEQEELFGEDLEMYSTNVTAFVDGKKYTFVVKKKKSYSLKLDGTEELSNLTAEIIMLGETGKEKTFTVEGSDIWDFEVFFSGKPTKENGEGLYMLTSRIKKIISKESVVAERKITELYELTGDDIFKKLTDEEYYSPLVLINGKGDSYSTLPAVSETEYAPSSIFEGYSEFYNVWHRYCFTTDGVSESFSLPIDNLYLCEIKIEYTNHSTGLTHTSQILKIDNSSLGSFTDDTSFNDFTIQIYPWEKNIQIIPKEGKSPLPSSLGFLTNNLIVYLKYYIPNENEIIDDAENPFYPDQINVSDSKLYGASISTSFGGSANGIYGGTRTFLAGFETADNQNMLAWSDLNNPTYFSENNYTYIGDKAQQITALKKQDDMLVIFKDNELYYSVYSSGTTYTAEDVLAGKVVDVTTLSATFPIIQIHSEIGCDLPNTIQLCGDRLVWACKDRHVYTLKSANQYSTTNISKISAMIDRKLLDVTDEEINDNNACIYNGYYLLKFGSKIFALNYDYYYFNTLPAYSDSNKSQRKLVWYLWEFPQGNYPIFSMFFANNNHCYLFYVNKFLPASGGLEYAQYNFYKLVDGVHQDDYLKQIGEINSSDFIGLDDVSSPIESAIQTKMFDFGAMDRFKKIEQLYIGFGETAGTTSIEYITDKGTLDRGSFELAGEADDYSPQYIKTKRFLPGVNRALRFGIRLTCEGRIAVDGILIKYKYLGVTR